MGKSRAAKLGDGRRIRIVIACCLVAITLAAFGRSVGFDFVGLDDGVYVSGNPMVRQGLTAEGVRWALTTVRGATWQPVTWLSYMADAQVAQCEPCVFHLTNVLMHAANAVLLFALLNMLTGALWRSAVVAALFALHPLRVESVAWVAERKDVLSALFWLLALWAYAGYARKPSVGRYLVVAVLYALGLMAKPMLVSLPLVMLGLDYWPLGRVGESAGRRVGELVREKLPLLAVAVGATVLTVASQRSIEAMPASPLGERVACAAAHYASYLGKTIWPARLAFLYPYEGSSLSVWAVAGSAALLAGVTAAVIWRRREAPYAAVGWLWYVVTLAPVVGLVRTGEHGIADRFTYIPHMGLFVAVVWAVGSVASRAKAAGLVMGAVLLALGAQTFVQVGAWRDTRTLYEHALRVTRGNAPVEFLLASELEAEGQAGEALAHYRRAVALDPKLAVAHSGLGVLMGKLGRLPEAEAHLRLSVELSPMDAKLRNNLGTCQLYRGNAREAVKQFEKALAIKPDYEEAAANLAAAKDMLGEEKGQ